MGALPCPCVPVTYVTYRSNTSSFHASRAGFCYSKCGPQTRTSSVPCRVLEKLEPGPIPRRHQTPVSRSSCANSSHKTCVVRTGLWREQSSGCAGQCIEEFPLPRHSVINTGMSMWAAPCLELRG